MPPGCFAGYHLTCAQSIVDIAVVSAQGTTLTPVVSGKFVPINQAQLEACALIYRCPTAVALLYSMFGVDRFTSPPEVAYKPTVVLPWTANSMVADLLADYYNIKIWTPTVRTDTLILVGMHEAAATRGDFVYTVQQLLANGNNIPQAAYLAMNLLEAGVEPLPGSVGGDCSPLPQVSLPDQLFVSTLMGITVNTTTPPATSPTTPVPNTAGPSTAAAGVEIKIEPEVQAAAALASLRLA